MVVSSSDDYELMPKRELEDLRREVSSLKKGSLLEGDKAKVLIESMDRLVISINRLITILDDAQADIIEEYQQSKPTEKLNQILEQNETIARALLAMHDNISSSSQAQDNSPQQLYPQQPAQQQYNVPPSMQTYNNVKSVLPISPQQNNPQSNSRVSLADNPFSMAPPSMPPLDDFPPMDNMPPLDNNIPTPPKKRFLGIM